VIAATGDWRRASRQAQRGWVLAEEKFSDPEHFDIACDTSEHLAFGFATHYCLGAQLARLEARVALEELFANPPYDVDRGRIERVSSLLLRGIKHMPMRFGD